MIGALNAIEKGNNTVSMPTLRYTVSDLSDATGNFGSGQPSPLECRHDLTSMDANSKHAITATLARLHVVKMWESVCLGKEAMDKVFKEIQESITAAGLAVPHPAAPQQRMPSVAPMLPQSMAGMMPVAEEEYPAETEEQYDEPLPPPTQAPQQGRRQRRSPG